MRSQTSEATETSLEASSKSIQTINAARLSLASRCLEAHGRGTWNIADEYNVYLARDATRMRTLGINTEVDRASEDLARDTVAEPVAKGLTAPGRRRIRERDSTLNHPEEPSADAACGSAKEDKPGGAEDVVRVQACGINYMGGVE